jgi:hypothetical protein
LEEGQEEKQEQEEELDDEKQEEKRGRNRRMRNIIRSRGKGGPGVESEGRGGWPKRIVGRERIRWGPEGAIIIRIIKLLNLPTQTRYVMVRDKRQTQKK